MTSITSSPSFAGQSIMSKEKAATTIQAAWRGFHVRSIMMQGSDCMICLDSLLGSTITKLNNCCKKYIHSNCLVDWVNKSPSKTFSCPHCRSTTSPTGFLQKIARSSSEIVIHPNRQQINSSPGARELSEIVGKLIEGLGIVAINSASTTGYLILTKEIGKLTGGDLVKGLFGSLVKNQWAFLNSQWAILYLTYLYLPTAIAITGVLRAGHPITPWNNLKTFFSLHILTSFLISTFFLSVDLATRYTFSNLT